jgi:hypothetical protein
MANAARRIQVGDRVSYLNPIVSTDQSTIRWRSAKVVGVTNQTTLTLAIVKTDGSRVNLNGGVAVSRWTRNAATNVWRPY